jgi:hypothetical protein
MDLRKRTSSWLVVTCTLSFDPHILTDDQAPVDQAGLDFDGCESTGGGPSEGVLPAGQSRFGD